MKDVLLVAHRGLFDNEKIIENTLPAFQKCIQQSIPFELDVQLTLDNQVVVFHDEDLSRLANQNIVVQESNYSDIKDIPLLQTDSHIPLLSDVLQKNQDHVYMDIEIKNTKRIDETVSYLMKELEGYHNYSLKSFHPKIVRMIKKHYPDISCGLLIHHHYQSFIHQILFHTPFMILYSRADFLSIHKKLLSQKRYQRLSHKYPLQIWTIKDSEEIDFNKNLTYICNQLPYNKKN